jgi:PEP-CTERM motif
MRATFCAMGTMLVLAVLLSVGSARAATIWTGPMTSYVQPGSDPGDPANWDVLTAQVALTRGPAMGLFNAVTESGYTATSPAGTAWAYTFNNPSVDPLDITASNYASLSFGPWVSPPTWRPPDLVGQPSVLWLMDEDIYLDVVVTSWGTGGVGGFSWNRSTVPEPSSLLLVAAGLIGFRLRSRRSRGRPR